MLIRCHSVTLTFDFKLDLELIQHFGCHVFKLCTKYERNQVSESFKQHSSSYPYPSPSLPSFSPSPFLFPFLLLPLPLFSSLPYPLFLPLLFISHFPGSTPPRKQLEGLGSAVISASGVWWKRIWCIFEPKRAALMATVSWIFVRIKLVKKLLICSKTNNQQEGSSSEVVKEFQWGGQAAVIKRRAYVFSAQLYIRQEVSWSQCSAADISHKHRRRKKSLVRGTMASPTPPLPSPSLPFLPLLSLTVSSPPLPSPFPYLSPFLTSHPLPFPLLEVGPLESS